MAEANAAAVKGYVFGDAFDKTKTAIFVEMLRRQQIEVYVLNNNLGADGYNFEKGNAFVVPAAQTQYKVIRAIFDKTLTYKDSLFYDITAWTMPLAFGLPYAELPAGKYAASLLGAKVDNAVYPKGEVAGGQSAYAYLFEWDEFYAPRALYELQQEGVLAKVATNTFEINVGSGSRKFDYGTISIPVKLQSLNPQALYNLVKTVAERNAIAIYAVATGNVTSGSDLGSSRMQNVTKPDVAMLVGAGVNATDAGEIWYLLDQRFNIPSTHLEAGSFNRSNIEKYNTIIMVGGNYGELNKDKLKSWVQGGGTLIVTEEAVQWAAQNGLTTVGFKKGKDDTEKILPYVEREQRVGAQRMNGAIFRANVDLTHPLAYGYNYPFVDLFKSNMVFPERNKNPYSNPYSYGDKPLQSGFITRENYEMLKNSGAVLVNASGSGRVISIADNPNFRAFWLGGTRLFLNSIFFGRNIEAASARND